MKKSARSDYAVVILGGGPAGCAAAISLADRGVAGVLLIETGNYEALRVGESIPPDTRLVLDRLGLWRDFLEEGHDVCYGSYSAWGRDKPGYNDFLFNPYGTGWHLDRRRFDAFLVQKAADGGAEVRTGTRFRSVESKREDGLAIRIAGDDGVARTIHADYVVDATGYRAAFAKAMGAESEILDSLICVYGFFVLDSESTLSRLTMLEAVRDGWWYAARLPGEKATAAFAVDPETVKQSGLRTNEGWLWSLSDTRHIAPALKHCRFLPGSLLTKPALSLLRRPVSGKRWLAVGDAASIYDPISAQGIYKALFDGAMAGAAIAHRIDGSTTSFDDYAAGVRDHFERYLTNRHYLYGLEQRWANSPFWKRRREAAEAAMNLFSTQTASVLEP